MPTFCNVLKAAGTAVISDVFDSFGILPPVLDNALRPIAAATPFAGPAYTITGEAVCFTGGDHAKLAAIDAMSEGVVALWTSMNAKGVCCFGDLLATAMRVRGCVAAVVDGGVRDVAFLQQCGMPIVSRYVTPAQGVGRWRVTASQQTVTIRGALTEWIEVSPGDIIVGDADGVIIIPQALVAIVTEKVIEWSNAETGARTDIQNGLPLLSALRNYGHL